MKVLYDHQVFEGQNIGGISRYFWELISRIKNTPNTQTQLLCKYSNNVYLPKSNQLKPIINSNYLFGNKNFKGQEFLTKSYRYFTQKENEEIANLSHSILNLKSNNFSVFHPTFNNPYFLPYLNNKPFVVTVHDMIDELYHNYDCIKNEKRKLCEKATHIIAVSNNTKKDLIDLFNIPEKKITVVYHGCSLTADNSKEAIVNFPYFLYVGSRYKYKNFTFLLQAITLFGNKFPEVKFVIAGLTLNKFEIAEISKLKIKNIITIINPSDKKLANLYSNAIGLIYPSSYEGFGIPILEAFECQCPVILNNLSCLPEIAGNAALYFENNNIESIITQMKILYESEAVSKQYIGLGNIRKQNFSWDICAQQTTKIYANIL